MIAETFLDTGILLEAANGASALPHRHDIAQGLLTTPFGTSAQVLSEFYTLATRSTPQPLPEETASRWVELLSQKTVQPVDAGLVTSAIALSREHDAAPGDTLILAAAEKLGCKTLFSERLTHGKTYGSVRVVNPFLEDTPAEEG